MKHVIGINRCRLSKVAEVHYKLKKPVMSSIMAVLAPWTADRVLEDRAFVKCDPESIAPGERGEAGIIAEYFHRIFEYDIQPRSA